MPRYRITLDPQWPLTDWLGGMNFVEGVAEVDALDDQALARLHEMSPTVEKISDEAPAKPAAEKAAPAA